MGDILDELDKRERRRMASKKFQEADEEFHKWERKHGKSFVPNGDLRYDHMTIVIPEKEEDETA